jgi:hypothetical protein
MATTVNIKKILHRPQWEACSAAPVANAAGTFWRALEVPGYNINCSFMMASTSVCYYYDVITDGYVQLATASIGPALAAGSCGRVHPVSISRTATAGTVSTITTNLTLVRDLRGYKIRITGGPSAAGQELTILSNTRGANGVITVATQGVAFTASTTYQLLTPNLYVVGSGAISASTFQRYDWALNTWTALTQTNLPTTIITDAALVATPSIVGGAFDSSATGGYSFNAVGATTLTINGPSWATNQWKNSQIRITAGTGAGQVRTISTNTGTQLTVSASWTANPAADSVWQIEGNDDYLYYFGGQAATTVIRYSISAGTWTALATTGGTARGGNPGAGMSGSWITGCTDAAWTAKNAIQNGRYIYSFRGGATATLDIMDIAGGDTTGTTVSWAATVLAYGNQIETFSTGFCWEYDGRDNIYAAGPGSTVAPMRTYRYNLITNELLPMHVLNYPQSTATVGDKMILVSYADGATTIDFLYHWRNTGTEVFRTMVSPFVY